MPGYRAVCANIRNNPDLPPWQVRKDTEHAAKFVHDQGGIGWQEIGEKSDQQAVADACPKETWVTEFDHVEVPVSVKGFTPQDTGIVHTTPGKPRTTPDRYFDWVVLTLPNGKRFAHMNTHYVSGAWNPKPRPNKAWRKEQWRKHYAAQKKQVLELRDQGITVIGTGDMNRWTMDKFHPSQQWCGTRTGIMKIFVVPAPGGAAVKVGKCAGVPGKWYTDHRPRYADLTLT